MQEITEFGFETGCEGLQVDSVCRKRGRQLFLASKVKNKEKKRSHAEYLLRRSSLTVN